MNDFEYIAFISYKREDEEWAKRLQKKLESYSMPTALRKENPSLPDKVRPIFRDQSDLSGGNLKKSIEEGLENSKYLIVVCSPQAAKSPWVSREVQYFIDHGREEYIIPFIIDGTPNAKNEEDECFPIGLRQLSGEKEILGININEMGRDAAVIKVIARMFGLRFDSLWQRHERAKRRKRFGWGAAAVAVIMFMGVVMQIINAERNKAIEQEKIAIEQREKAETERKRADAQTVIAQQERDKALRANADLKVANDSISKQSTMIAQANRDLSESNRRLAEERDNVKRANWKMMENRARAVAEKANQLIDEGDSYLAQLLCMEVLPEDLDRPEKPYLPEVESVFRRAISNNSMLASNRMDRTRYFFDIGIFSTDCKLVLTPAYTNKNWCLFKTNDGSIIRKFNTTSKCKLSPNGRYVSYLKEKDVKSNFISFTLEDINKMSTDTLSITCKGLKLTHSPKIAFSGNSKYIYTFGYANRIDVWNLETRGHEKTIECERNYDILLPSHDGNTLYAYEWHGTKEILQIDVWDIVSSQIIKCIPGFKNPISSLDLNSDNSYLIATCKGEKTIKIWDLTNDSIMHCIDGIKANVSVFGTTSNIFAYGTTDNILRILDINGNEIYSQDIKFGIRNLRFSDNDSSISILGNKNEYTKILIESTPIPSIFHSESNIYDFIYDKKFNRIISTSEDGTVKIGDIGNMEMQKCFHTGFPITSICLSHDGKGVYYGHLISVYGSPKYRGKVSYLNLDTLESYDFDADEGCKFRSITVHPSGDLLAYGNSSGQIKIYSTLKKQLVKEFSVHSYNGSKACSFSHDGKYLLVGNYDGEIYLYETTTWQRVSMFNEHSGEILSVKFDSNDNYFVSSSDDHNIKVWDIKTGLCINTLIGHSSTVEYAEFCIDNNHVISCSGNNIKIWDIASGLCLDTYSYNNKEKIYKTLMDITKNCLIFCKDGFICFDEYKDLQTLIDITKLRFKDRILNNDDKRRYFLE